MTVLLTAFDCSVYVCALIPSSMRLCLGVYMSISSVPVCCRCPSFIAIYMCLRPSSGKLTRSPGTQDLVSLSETARALYNDAQPGGANGGDPGADAAAVRKL